ncbi:MAG: hypothetical protein K2O38_06295 [Muribaculaceae bacterium]|nr:hypothetical protein [Muribaculaceae bacterium]
MNKTLTLAAGALLALSSCTTVQHTASTEQIETRIINMTVANVDVSKEKAQHTFNWQWNPANALSLNSVKKSAAAELLMEQKADVLVEPQYVINRRGLFRGGSITVTGYPAKYTDFRPMTETDAKLLGESSPKVTRPYIPSTIASPFKKLKKAKAAFEPENTKKQFISFVAGPVFELCELDAGGTYALMYGRYNTKGWGWYVKGNLSAFTEGRGEPYGGFVTAGAIKPLSSKFNLMFGAGLGTALMGSYTDDYDDNIRYDNEFSVPVELMGQFNFGHVNVSAGINYQVTYGDSELMEGNLSLQFGIGYTF